MPTTIVADPKGQEYEVEHPPEASDEEILDYAQKHFGGGQPPAQPQIDQQESPYLTAAKQTAYDIGVGIPTRLGQRVVGLLKAPGQLRELAQGFSPLEALTSPSQLATAAKETGKQLLSEAPTIAGAAIGSLGGPLGMATGAAAGKFLGEALKRRGQGAAGVREAALEGATSGLETGILAGAPGGFARVTGRTPAHYDPSMAQSFRNVNVTPMVSDVTTGRFAAPLEKTVGGFLGGSSVIGKRHAQQFGETGAAFKRGLTRLGPTPLRADIGDLTSDAVTSTLKINQGIYEGKKNLVRTLARDQTLDTLPVRKAAVDLLQEISQQPYQAFSTLYKESGLLPKLREIVLGTPPRKGAPGTPPLTELTFDQWDAFQKLVGSLSRSNTVVGTPLEGAFKKLYKSTQEMVEGSNLHPLIREAADYYRENIVPLTSSTSKLGKIATGRMAGEEAGSLLSKTGLTNIKDLELLAPSAVKSIRNRFLQDLFQEAGAVSPQTGINPTKFRDAWNAINPETKQALFKTDQATLQFFDDLAKVADRISWKRGPGSAPANLPLGQFFALVGAPSAVLGGLFGGVGGMTGAGVAAMAGLPLAARIAAKRLSYVKPPVTLGRGGKTAAALSPTLAEYLRQKGGRQE